MVGFTANTLGILFSMFSFLLIWIVGWFDFRLSINFRVNLELYLIRFNSLLIVILSFGLVADILRLIKLLLVIISFNLAAMLTYLTITLVNFFLFTVIHFIKIKMFSHQFLILLRIFDVLEYFVCIHESYSVIRFIGKS